MRKEDPAVLRRNRALYRDRLAGMSDAEIMKKYELVQPHRIGSIVGAHKNRLEQYEVLHRVKGRRFLVKFTPLSKRAKKVLLNIGVSDLRQPGGRGLEDCTLPDHINTPATQDEIHAYMERVRPWEHPI